MIITIDTKKDSPEDIRQAIDILKQYSHPAPQSDSEILASIPKFHNTQVLSTHRPSGPGIFDIQKTKIEQEVPVDKVLEKTAELQVENIEQPKHKFWDNSSNLAEEEKSTFKTELFPNNNNNNNNDEKKLVQSDFYKEEKSPTKSEIEHHGGRITRGTAPDFTSYLDLLKQKRDTTVLGMISEKNQESKDQY